MSETRTVNVLGTKSAKAELPAELFDVQTNVPLIHQVVVAQQAAARQGTHSTKTRGEVRGGGAKPWRQKGTGRARQGSTRAPQFVGGGTVHGPTPRSYEQRTPKKMKAAALRGALSDRARNDRIHVATGFLSDDSPSTKAAVASLRAMTENAKLLVVVSQSDENTWKSLRNAADVHVLAPEDLLEGAHDRGGPGAGGARDGDDGVLGRHAVQLRVVKSERSWKRGGARGGSMPASWSR